MTISCFGGPFQKASLRPAEATGGELAGRTTVSPVNGHPEGARGQQVLGTPVGPLVPQTSPGRAAPVGEHCALLVHPGTAPVAG